MRIFANRTRSADWNKPTPPRTGIYLKMVLDPGRKGQSHSAKREENGSSGEIGQRTVSSAGREIVHPSRLAGLDSRRAAVAVAGAGTDMEWCGPLLAEEIRSLT